MTITCSEYADMLADVDAKLHDYALNGKVESVQDGENKVTYSKYDAKSLLAYRNALQAKVDACNGVTNRRVIHFTPVDC